MRANLLDELHKPYVVTARAKGMTETHLTLKYPVRVALNPFVSTVGWTLPAAGLRRGHRLHRSQPAHHRTAAAAGAPVPGHVSGRQLHPAAERR